MTTAIDLQGVWVEYQLRHAHHYNLKRTVTNLITRRIERPEIITALRDIDLTVAAGQRLGITGPNGSGKSTLLSVVTGVLTPTRGHAVVNGRVLALLGGPSQGLDPEQTGEENVVALGVRLGESPAHMQSLLPSIIEFSGLGDRALHPVYTYSSGMQIRLRFSTITALEADILVVDEGIGMADAEFNERANGRLADFYASAGTLILASHSPDVVAQHCDTTIGLTTGVLTSSSTPLS